MIKIYTICLSEIQEMEEYLFLCADSERKEKAIRFRRADDRLRCLSAGYLMKHYVPGFSEKLLRIGAQGKPYLPEGIPFNVSHGGDYIVLAVCGEVRSIGVDVEPVREMEYYRDILPYSMTENERLFAGDDENRAARLWTRKESLYKCFGEGIGDISEMPEVVQDQVSFSGDLFRLKSWKTDDHMFSVAWPEDYPSREQNIKRTAVQIPPQAG